MHTLRNRTRVTFSALLVTAILAAMFMPLLPTPSVAAEESRVMATEQVYVRSGPSTDDAIIGELWEGDWVSTTGYSENGFVEIWYGDWIGYAYGDYLDLSGTAAPVADETTADTSSEISWGADGWLYTLDVVNLRSGPSVNDGILSEIPAGVSVYHTGATSGVFAQVDSDYGFGWIHTDYLGLDAPVVAPEPEPEPEPEPVPAGPGQQMVDFAMQFHGYPYVWAGNTPGGFDCSGFTQYVVQNVLGYDITHSTDIQSGYGTPVAWGDWQPGDLIFFVGTGGGGYVSHVGIYIGDGNMIHAENPGTGVVISSLYSSYYSNHYYSARRL